MSRRAVVHIGLPKTGTTAIQQTLYAGRKFLFERGVLYPSARQNHSVLMGALFRETPPRHLAFGTSVDAARDSFRTKLYSELDADWQTIVFSAESVSYFSAEDTRRLIDFLTPYVSEIRCIVFLRDPADWTRSWVQQRVKEGQTLDDLYTNIPTPRWRAALNPWIKYLGVDAIRVETFEAAKTRGVVRAFCQISEIPEPPAPEGLRNNESMSRDAVLAIDALNKHVYNGTHHSRQERWKLVRKIRDISGQPFELPDEVREAALLAGERQVKWFEQVFGYRLYGEPKDN